MASPSFRIQNIEQLAIRWNKTLLSIVGALLLSGCVSPQQVKDPKIVYRELGIATWTGSYYHGRPTASGEPYNMFGFTAAHKTLALGTLLQVTDLSTGQSVEVKVNDRGPFIDRRAVVSLSYGAAKKLNMVERGLANVELKAIGRVPILKPTTKKISKRSESYLVQIGSFRIRENALRMKEIVADLGEKPFVESFEIAEGRIFRVRLGPYASEEIALSVVDRLLTALPKGSTIAPIVVENN